MSSPIQKSVTNARKIRDSDDDDARDGGWSWSVWIGKDSIHFTSNLFHHDVSQYDSLLYSCETRLHFAILESQSAQMCTIALIILAC
jgi:hypothetical protein